MLKRAGLTSERCLFFGLITHDGHPGLAQHVSNAVQRSTRRGFRFDKPADTTKIDGLIALTMAFAPPQPVEPAVVYHGWL